MHALSPDASLVSKAAPLLVPLVENGRGKKGDPLVEAVLVEYLQPMLDFGVDTLVLGCTHYPLLSPLIADIMGEKVRLIDSGECVAVEARRRLAQERMLRGSGSEGTKSYYVSDCPDGYAVNAEIFLLRPLDTTIQKVDIEDYT